MLLGEPCRLYHYNNITKTYEFMGVGYYIGNGYCVKDCFTDIRDNLSKGVKPYFLHYDRYIPTRLWNKDYQYAKERGVQYQSERYPHHHPHDNANQPSKGAILHLGDRVTV